MEGGPGRAGGERKGRRAESVRREDAYASAVCAIALIANRSFTHNFAVNVDFPVWLDIAGAAAAVRDDRFGRHDAAG